MPNYVQSEGNAKFRVNFKPQEAAMHSLSVRFNGEPVPGMMKKIIQFYLSCFFLHDALHFRYEPKIRFYENGIFSHGIKI